MLTSLFQTSSFKQLIVYQIHRHEKLHERWEVDATINVPIRTFAPETLHESPKKKTIEMELCQKQSPLLGKKFFAYLEILGPIFSTFHVAGTQT